MQSFISHKGLVMPLDRPNVDTDTIIPKQYLKSIKKTGFGSYLFDDWRYLAPGDLTVNLNERPLNKDFVLNHDRYQGVSILLARENFGCGSSREHAVWALLDKGFRVVIASSYSDIFYSNAFKNGLLVIRLETEVVESLFEETYQSIGYQLKIDLETCQIETPSGQVVAFVIEKNYRDRLLQGLDDIDITLSYAEDIKAYEAKQSRQVPWLFTDL